MYIKEQLNRLAAIMEAFTSVYGELANFYGDLTGELPPLRFVDAPAPANSEVKKIRRRKYFVSRHHSRRWITQPRKASGQF